MKRNYCLVFMKSAKIHKRGMQIIVPMALYRKRGKFHIDYVVTDRNMMNIFQCWFWYLVILFYGKRSEDLFAYKRTAGRVLVRKMY